MSINSYLNLKYTSCEGHRRENIGWGEGMNFTITQKKKTF